MTDAEIVREKDAPRLRDFAAQGALFDGLMQTLREGTFVHAYLICGMSGVGKRTLAHLMGQHFLCRDTGEDKPCGRCPSCIRFVDGTHPDVIHVRMEKSISVETIREVVRQAGEHTYEGGRRVIFIEQADKMTPGAQNALLKTLEEPRADNVFLLICEDTSLLLPTIVSRCRVLKLHPWSDGTVEAALRKASVPDKHIADAVRLSGGSIGMALATAQDEAFWQRRQEVMQDFFSLHARSMILGVSLKWKDRKDQGDELLRDVEEMIRTLLLVHLGQLDQRNIATFPTAWQNLAKKADDATFARLLDAVFEARRLKNNQVTWQAVVERLLLHLTEEVSAWST